MFKKTTETGGKTKTMGDPNALTSIAAGTELKGDIVSEGPIRIEGTLIGSLKTKGKLIVGTSGIIEGEVACQSADISGSTKGHLMVAELLNLQSTAKAHGEIVYGKLGVEPGAVLSGNCQMAGVVKDISRTESQNNREKTA